MSTVRTTGQWNKLPMESPFWEVFKKKVGWSGISHPAGLGLLLVRNSLTRLIVG